MSMDADCDMSRSDKFMQFDSEGKKKPYSSPTLTKLSTDQAKQFVASNTNCSDQEAADLLESLRQEQQQNKQ